DGRRIEAAAGELEQQPRDRRLYEMNTGGLQRLEESTGEADGDDILLPDLLAPAGDETQRPRLRLRGPIETAEQQARRRVVTEEFAAIHVTVAGAVLQGNAPLPAGLTRGGTGVWRGLRHAFAGHGHGAIAGQPATPVFVAGVQRLLDEQPAKTRAVDEQIARHHPAVLEFHGFDETVLGVLLHVNDLACDAFHAIRLGDTPQEARVQPGIEV